MLIVNPVTRKVEHMYRLVDYDLMDELLELYLGVIDQHDELVFELMVLIDSTANAWDGMITFGTRNS